MEQKEFNELMDAQKKAIKSETLSEIQAKVDEYKAEVKKDNTTLAEIKVGLEEVDKRAKAIEVELATQRKFGTDAANSQKGFGTIVNEQLTAKAADLKALQERKGGNVNFDVKAAATMTLSNYSGGTVGLTTWDPSFALVPRRTPYLRQLVNVRPVADKYVAWAEQANRDGGAGNTAEGAAKTMADFDIVEANKQVEKITAYTKASKESLADISFLQSEIQSDLLSLINLKLDTDLLGGSGTTPVIKGINTYATAFSVAATSLSLGIDNANEFDVLRAAIWQVENNYFVPNYIVLNPVDVAKIDMLKSTTNEYLIHPGGSQFMFKTFYGVPVIANNGMTAGSFLVGDFSKSNLGIREDVNISIGYENDDFTKNLITILAEMRAVHYIKSNHTTAFVKGTFTAAKALLETA